MKKIHRWEPSPVRSVPMVLSCVRCGLVRKVCARRSKPYSFDGGLTWVPRKVTPPCERKEAA